MWPIQFWGECVHCPFNVVIWDWTCDLLWKSTDVSSDSGCWSTPTSVPNMLKVHTLGVALASMVIISFSCRHTCTTVCVCVCVCVCTQTHHIRFQNLCFNFFPPTLTHFMNFHSSKKSSGTNLSSSGYWLGHTKTEALEGETNVFKAHIMQRHIYHWGMFLEVASFYDDLIHLIASGLKCRMGSHVCSLVT